MQERCLVKLHCADAWSKMLLQELGEIGQHPGAFKINAVLGLGEGQYDWSAYLHERALSLAPCEPQTRKI